GPWLESGASRSMVVILRARIVETGVMQDRVGCPSTWTVHAPHNPAPQPYFVPVSWSVSRSTQRSGVAGSTSGEYWRPFMVRGIGTAGVPCGGVAGLGGLCFIPPP